MGTLNPELSLQIIQPIANFCAISDVGFLVLSFYLIDLSSSCHIPALHFAKLSLKIFQVDEHLYDKLIL